MTRTGARAETLAYAYSSGTNNLSKVTVGGVQKSYAYNADGTMKTDGLRGLTVTYNALKLPKQVKASSNTGTVDYVYDALGNKLAVRQGGTLKNVYCGDFVYNTSLAVEYIITPNGQLTRNPSTGAYTAQYNITDHLGTLDYGARHYDPRIARWTVPDPMAEKYYGVSAYVYCANAPNNYIDPNGQGHIGWLLAFKAVASGMEHFGRTLKSQNNSFLSSFQWSRV